MYIKLLNYSSVTKRINMSLILPVSKCTMRYTGRGGGKNMNKLQTSDHFGKHGLFFKFKISESGPCCIMHVLPTTKFWEAQYFVT